MKGPQMKITKILILVFALTFTFLLADSIVQNRLNAQAGQTSAEKIAFIRNGDIWLMNADGSDQKPWVAQITNAKGRLSWAPDNKRLVFSRQGKVDIKYPEGGGGYHLLYDLFYAYIDSIGVKDNFWYGFTMTLGAQSPDWSKDGSVIGFSYDLSGNTVDATAPDYTVGFFNTTTEEITHITLPKEERNLMALMPAISPDGKQTCFILAEMLKAQMKKLGMVVTSTDKVTKSGAELVEMASQIPDALSPAWSPDGKLIAFLKTDGVYVANSDLSNPRLVCKPEEGLWVAGMPSWSPDSKKLAYGTSNGAIYIVNLDGSGIKRISGPGNDSNPAWTK
jgi:Tol biopolymer transport system component